MKLDYKALWSKKLKVATALFVGLCLGLAWVLPSPASLILVGVVVLAAAFSVRGYSLRGGQLLIHRLGWATRLELSGLKSAEFAPDVTVGSIRTFGIGGLFAFVGQFRNATLGNYRAYVTDSAKTVVLEWEDRKVVISPHEPDSFVAAVKRIHPEAASRLVTETATVRPAESES